jgi:hypothetical protein
MNMTSYPILFLLLFTVFPLFGEIHATEREKSYCFKKSETSFEERKKRAMQVDEMDESPFDPGIRKNDLAACRIEPVNINTPGAELGSFFFRDGIVFSSTSWSGTPGDKKFSPDEIPFLDLYFSKELEPGRFSEPVPFAPNLKTPFNDGPVTWDPEENLLYITRYVPQGAARKYDASYLHLQIVVAEEQGKEWVFKDPFFLKGPDVSVAHPSVSPDGQRIFFVSDMPGGYGGYDIYFCYKKEDHTWSEPYNIGPYVNSQGDEYFPYTDSRGSLYFSSDGHPGLGGQDIFLATSESGVYNTITNLGEPLNSSMDDVALMLAPNAERGYFSSDRESGMGYFDLYSVVFTHIPVTLRGVIKDLHGNAALALSKVKILDSEGDIIRESTTQADGSFSFVVNKTLPLLRILIEKQGYESLEKPLDLHFLQSKEEMVLEVFMRKE